MNSIMWNTSVEEILLQTAEIINTSLDGTDYYAQRNSTLGEKSVDIFRTGDENRVAHIWPKKRKQCFDVCVQSRFISKLSAAMELPESSDIKPGRYPQWINFKATAPDTAIAIVTEMAK